MSSEKKKNAGGNQKPTPNIQSDDYDLKKNFSKINTYRETSRTEPTLSDNCVFCQQYNQSVNSSIYQQTQRETTADQFGNTYFQLDNKIDKLSDKIESSNKDLRKELEEKIDKKLSKQWYTWTVVAIVAIVSLIFVLSYKPLIEKVDKISETLSVGISPNRSHLDSVNSDNLNGKEINETNINK